MNWRSFMVPQKLAVSSSKFNKKIEVIESFGKKQLLVNGIVQTGSYPSRIFSRGIKKLVSWHHGRMDDILVFGIGGGNVFLQLRNIYPDATIIGIDIDPEIIALAKQQFGVGNISNCTFIESDASQFVQNPSNQNTQFDSIIIDIYIGNDVPKFIASEQFLRHITLLLRDGGSVMFNYFSFISQRKKSLIVKKILENIYSDVEMEKNLRNIFYYCRL